jgi:hypothetical protein
VLVADTPYLHVPLHSQHAQCITQVIVLQAFTKVVVLEAIHSRPVGAILLLRNHCVNITRCVCTLRISHDFYNVRHPVLCRFGDCNGKPEDGCEVNLMTDPNNCGACGKVVATLPNAVATCTSGKPAIVSCSAG